MDTQTTTDLTTCPCCGTARTRWGYSFEGYADAWPATEADEQQVWAVSRADVLNWLTSFRPTAHEVTVIC